MSWNEADVPDQTDRLVLITGANSGIGYEAARVLAENNATVVMACRSLERGAAAVDRIRESTGRGTLVVVDLDLADLESVRGFPDRYLEALTAEGVDDTDIDVLINNAGIMAIPRGETEDGFEKQFGVNHLGHFALTAELFEGLADDARIVTVSSRAHESGEIDFEDLHGEESYKKWGAYSQSKLANVLFAYELDRRIDETDGEQISVACHPGLAATELQGRGPRMAGSRVRLALMGVLNKLFAQSAAMGALPTLYAATAPDVEGGEYYGPGGLFKMRGAPERQRSNEQSYDRELAAQLWDVSEELTGVEFDLE